MKIYLIGGTGLLGSSAAKELLARGHEVSAIAFKPLPPGAELSEGMKLEYGDYNKMSDDELRARFTGCQGFIFASGIDERIEAPPPIYELFKKYNNDSLKRLLTLAKECGVKHAAVCGSYFSYFSKVRPKEEFPKWHPYVRARLEQEEICMGMADENFDVAVLELPYIFGTMTGRKPVWVFVVEMLRKMKPFTFFCKGGTTMVTVRQVGEALAGAIERNRGGNCYPIGWYNVRWTEMLKIFHQHMGCPKKKVVVLPTWMFKFGLSAMRRKQKKHGLEGGVHMVKFARLQCTNQFIDKELGCIPLGVTPDDINAAIGQSVRLSLEILDTGAEVVEMRWE